MTSHRGHPAQPRVKPGFVVCISTISNPETSISQVPDAVRPSCKLSFLTVADAICVMAMNSDLLHRYVVDRAPMSYLGVIVSLGLLAVALSVYLHGTRPNRRDEYRSAAPAVPGLPLLGNTVSLAMQGASFLHYCRKLVCQLHLSTVKPLYFSKCWTLI